MTAGARARSREVRPTVRRGERPAAPRPDGSAATVLALQRTAGNQAVAQVLGRAALQRMTLPLDDLVALAAREEHPSLEDVEHARTTSEAVSDRVRATGEGVARPHQLAVGDRAGGLAGIGLTEELRVFGHGAPSDVEHGAVVTIGGYRAADLARLIISMGLPPNYAGEIYLAGCLSAVGLRYGYLGEFYEVLRAHSRGVLVRGNLGAAITFADGTQGVANGVMSSEQIEEHQTAYRDEGARLVAQAEELRRKLDRGELEPRAVLAQLGPIRTRMEALPGERLAFLHTVYDSTGAFTVQLPSAKVQAGNAIDAVVSGAVTRAEDVEAVLNRIDGFNLHVARDRLDVMMVHVERSLSSLAERTERLSEPPVTFRARPRV